uniref:Smad nuclear interacting protein 1 n=1 Tax=Paramormyrops kingsleyae TaxID=1676925 RepID=A0A3B3RQ82_9TELE|nr:smad nuclear-interacting protein 1 [Paramormyrops kingsleyae]
MEMDRERRHRRHDSPRETKIRIKQEKLSPARPQRSRRSSSGSNRGSASPVPQRRRASKSPARRGDRSSGRRESRSPRRKRSRSPPRGSDVKIKRERDSHCGEEDRRRHNRRDGEDERRGGREAERPRHRERGGREGAERQRDRDARAFHEQQAERVRHDERRREHRHCMEAGGQDAPESPTFGSQADSEAPVADKEKPNFELSGALVEDTNTFRGVVIKYNEPPEARIPKRRWRLYPFKNDEPLPVMYIHRQSAYLLGRQRKIADIPIDHPSCSKQHAVFQYRLVEFTRADGTTGRKVKPYIIDLGSGNGTYLNNQRVEAQRYYELKEKDVLKFGFSSREYVLLHEFSDTTEVDEKRDEEDEGMDE